MIQVADHLLNKHRALSLNTSTTKKKLNKTLKHIDRYEKIMDKGHTVQNTEMKKGGQLLFL
jgi:hypothetical protein